MSGTLRWRVYRGTTLICAVPGSRFHDAAEAAAFVRQMPEYARAKLIVHRYCHGPVETTTHAPEELAA